MSPFCKMKIIATHLLEKYYESQLLDAKIFLQNVVNIQTVVSSVIDTHD